LHTIESLCLLSTDHQSKNGESESEADQLGKLFGGSRRIMFRKLFLTLLIVSCELLYRSGSAYFSLARSSLPTIENGQEQDELEGALRKHREQNGGESLSATLWI
jgi:hypothetical protein